MHVLILKHRVSPHLHGKMRQMTSRANSVQHKATVTRSVATDSCSIAGEEHPGLHTGLQWHP